MAEKDVARFANSTGSTMYTLNRRAVLDKCTDTERTVSLPSLDAVAVIKLNVTGENHPFTKVCFVKYMALGIHIWIGR